MEREVGFSANKVGSVNQNELAGISLRVACTCAIRSSSTTRGSRGTLARPATTGAGSAYGANAGRDGTLSA